MVLYGETLNFTTRAKVATAAEIDNGSTLRDTCLAAELQKSFTKPTMLRCAKPAENLFHSAVEQKFHLKVSTLKGGLIDDISLLCHA